MMFEPFVMTFRGIVTNGQQGALRFQLRGVFHWPAFFLSSIPPQKKTISLPSW